MTKWLRRQHDAAMPFQTWRPFPPEAIVQIANAFGDTKVGQVKDFWWGYEEELGGVGEGVIVAARRLDKPRAAMRQDKGGGDD